MARGTVAGLFVKPKVAGEDGLPKRPVIRADLLPEGLVGDFNNYRQEELHGDPDSAVLLVPQELLDDLRAEGWPLRPGDLGENLATRGIPWTEFRSGRSIEVGRATLETTRACTPCRRLAGLPYVGDARLAEFLKATMGRRGWYARVVQPGAVAEGDEIVIDG